jgi:inorganic pyrophosphatase
MAPSTFDKLGAWDGDSGRLNVVIETPKGSCNKFDFNHRQGLFELGKVLPKGMAFPYDYGFVPGTIGADGDPLDVLVLMDEPAFPGCKVLCRLIGVIEEEQINKLGKRVRNDRLIAIAQESRNDKATNSVKQLSDHLMAELEHFFSAYHAMDGHRCQILGVHGPKKAEKLVRAGTKRFRNTPAGKTQAT